MRRLERDLDDLNEGHRMQLAESHRARVEAEDDADR